ncbi:IS701 family transposase [Leptolyngbya ohadii]|uniref:IS701 family transposase n=1 Tax=Leptolyngbya ohadii TaxID=1962290 RepID=UPI000B59FBBF|nr:IS701 family transposase [Leptolyngbya ohadii]
MELRQPVATVGFIDDYCLLYRAVFEDVRLYECFKWLHVGMLSPVSRKTLPEIAKLVGLKDGQSLHHFLRDALWQVEQVRAIRLHLIRQQIGSRPISLCIDETGDVKKGNTTDYVARQYIGNIGTTANGIVSVNAYAVVDGITYPLLFKIYKPKSRLKADESYQSKPQLAIDIIREIQTMGFTIERVLADSLYGESSEFISFLQQLQLPYIVAIRSNHGVLMPKAQRVRYNRWHAYDQPLVQHPTQRRYIREIIFGTRRSVRYYQITKGSTDNPDNADSWFIMTNLTGDIIGSVGSQYTLRAWIEYGFKQVKNELGWHDYRLTDYKSIERWWEIIFSAYLVVSLHADVFKRCQQGEGDEAAESTVHPLPFGQHRDWEMGTTWKSALNNLRLLIQPYWCWGWLEQWIQVFPIPGLKRALHQLMDWMDTFRILPERLLMAA